MDQESIQPVASTRAMEEDKKEAYQANDDAARGMVTSATTDITPLAHQNVGLAVIEQRNIIPTTGVRKVATSLEYWMYIVYYIGGQGVGVGNYGSAVQQALINEQFPQGVAFWGGKYQQLNSIVLDLNGIIFAVQLAFLLLIGPYADYGNWRPYLLIAFTILLWGMTLGFAGLKDPSSWQTANALYVLGSIALNLSNIFYWAAFPGLVRDLPKMVKSEEDVLEGRKAPDEHAQLDMLERSKIYNLVNIIGSGGNLVLLGVATGVAYKIGTANQAELDQGYRVIVGLFGAITVLTTIPWFLVEQHRPGQALPSGVGWFKAGPYQIWEAGKCCWNLRHAFLYLVAFFLLQDVYGTSGTVTGILQNKAISFSTLDFSALTLILYFTGGTGTILVMWIQTRWKLSVRTMLLAGAIPPLLVNLWGMVGNWTDKVGYHHAWEFWALAGYNFTQAAWGSYNITMITEVVPAPKIYLFMALFNTVGKTSQFIGPFITSAIINDAHGKTNTAFYFLFFAGILGYVILCFVNPDQAKIDNAKYLEREAEDLYGRQIPTEKGIVTAPVVRDV